MITMIIGADFVPTKSNEKLFKNANTDELFGSDLTKVIMEADYKVFNLEVPLSNNEFPIEKNGPNLIANIETSNIFVKLGIDVFTLGNNHIMDQNVNGLCSTIDVLKKCNIGWFGAGKNLQEAEKPYIFSIGERNIGLYACTEHEFSVADINTPGANPFDALNSFKHVEHLKNKVNYVIVLYHGGKEYYRFPSPSLQLTCRKFVDSGANLVVCQHSHCIGCEELYKEGTIVYGQGNFLFDRSNDESWRTGLLISLNQNFEVHYIPIVKKCNTVRLADESLSNSIMLDFKKRSGQIKNTDFVEQEYIKLSKKNIDDYLWTISGASDSLFYRILNRLSGYRFSHFYVNHKYRRKNRLALINYFECEAHRELIIEGLKQK